MTRTPTTPAPTRPAPARNRLPRRSAAAVGGGGGSRRSDSGGGPASIPAGTTRRVAEHRAGARLRPDLGGLRRLPRRPRGGARGSARRVVWARDRAPGRRPSRSPRSCSPTTSTATSTTPGSASSTASTPTSTRPLAAPADPAFAEVTWTEATSAYGPLFTLATYPLAWLPVGARGRGAEGARRRSPSSASPPSSPASPPGAAPTRCAPPPSSPSTRWSSSTSSAAPTTTAWRCCWRCSASPPSSAPARPRRGAALVAAIAIKASAAFIAPFALLATAAAPRLTGRIRLDVGLSARRPAAGRGRLAIVAIGAAAYLAFGWDWLHAFGLAGENQGRTSHMSIPITFARLTGLDPDAGPRRRPSSSSLALVLAAAALDLARRRLGPRRRLDRRSASPRHLLAPPLVPDLAPPPRRDLPRPPPPTPDPRPDRLPARSPHPALGPTSARDSLARRGARTPDTCGVGGGGSSERLALWPGVNSDATSDPARQRGGGSPPSALAKDFGRVPALVLGPCSSSDGCRIPVGTLQPSRRPSAVTAPT